MNFYTLPIQILEQKKFLMSALAVWWRFGNTCFDLLWEDMLCCLLLSLVVVQPDNSAHIIYARPVFFEQSSIFPFWNSLTYFQNCNKICHKWRRIGEMWNNCRSIVSTSTLRLIMRHLYIIKHIINLHRSCNISLR